MGEGHLGRCLDHDGGACVNGLKTLIKTPFEDPDAGKDWRQEEKGTTEDEMVGWHHWLNGHEFEWTPGVGDGQGGLACCSPWGSQRVGHDWATELNWKTPQNTLCSSALWGYRIIWELREGLHPNVLYSDLGLPPFKTVRNKFCCLWNTWSMVICESNRNTLTVSVCTNSVCEQFSVHSFAHSVI